MTVSDVTSRISQIQAQLALLAPASNATSAAAFSSALNGATSATSTASTSTIGGTTSGTAKGDAVVEGARKYLGVPYVWGGTDPAKGLDCSGLVQKVYGELGYDLPRVSHDQAKAGTAVASLADA